MSLWVRIENGQVTACVDTPQTGDNWFPAVEVRPPLRKGWEYYGAHFFDAAKNPVEIVWPILPVPLQDRKSSMKAQARQTFLTRANALVVAAIEPLGGDYDIPELERHKAEYEATVAAIDAATSHGELDDALHQAPV